jgi:hypothetical protein
MIDVIALPAACVRSLRTLGARDHRFAEQHRKSSQAQRSRAHQPRADRLRLIAARADARATLLFAEAR